MVVKDLYIDSGFVLSSVNISKPFACEAPSRDHKMITHKNNVTENDRNINSRRKIFITYKSLSLCLRFSS